RPPACRTTSRTSILKISASSLPSLALLALMGVGGATGLAAQGVVVSGRVLYGPAGRALARPRVVLHQVSMGGDGRPIDSTSTDAQGRYTLTIRRPDSTAMYVVSSWHAGIAYFSEPVVPSRSTSVPLRALYVYDTSSAGPAVRVAGGLVSVAKLKRDGSRDVLGVLVLWYDGRSSGDSAGDVGRSLHDALH